MEWEKKILHRESKQILLFCEILTCRFMAEELLPVNIKSFTLSLEFCGFPYFCGRMNLEYSGLATYWCSHHSSKLLFDLFMLFVLRKEFHCLKNCSSWNEKAWTIIWVWHIPLYVGDIITSGRNRNISEWLLLHQCKNTEVLNLLSVFLIEESWFWSETAALE